MSKGKKRKIQKSMHVNKYEGEVGKPLHHKRKAEKAAARAKTAYEPDIRYGASAHYGQGEEYSPLLRTPSVAQEGPWAVSEDQWGYQINSQNSPAYIESVICRKNSSGDITNCFIKYKGGSTESNIGFPLKDVHPPYSMKDKLKLLGELETINNSLGRITDQKKNIRDKERERRAFSLPDY